MAEVIDSSGPTIYQIRVRSHLGCEWTDWFEGLDIQCDPSGESGLFGPLPDQEALLNIPDELLWDGMHSETDRQHPERERQQLVLGEMHDPTNTAAPSRRKAVGLFLFK